MLRVEIADTPRNLEKGLMFRKDLGSDRGMLFRFNYPQILNFWGKNTLLPLDIAFIDSDNVIKKISHIPPLSEKPVSSEHACKMAIEANLGYFNDNKIQPGQKAKIDKINDQLAIITFHNNI